MLIEPTAKAGEATQRPGTEETIYYNFNLPVDIWGTVTPNMRGDWLREMHSETSFTDRSSLLTGSTSANANSAISRGVTNVVANTWYRVGVQFDVGGNDIYTRYMDIYVEPDVST